jgi:hypothetical protein
VSITSLSQTCPYCGEPIELLVDEGDLGQEYIEDCQVCCQPMAVAVLVGMGGEPMLTLRRDSD